MPDYGYLIVRNPGPATAVEYGGLDGYPQPEFADAQSTWDAAQALARPGDIVHLLVVYDAGEADGACQLASHLGPDEIAEGES